MGSAILKASNVLDGSTDSGQNQERLKDNNNASATMMYQAMFRYAGYLEKDPRIRTNDNLGIHFVDRLYRCVFALPGGPQLIRYATEKSAPGLYGFSCCRSVLGDRAFLEFMHSHSGGSCQIINLSGGFCTRFERYRSELTEHAESCTYMELDFPASQASKLSLAAKARFRFSSDPLPNYYLMEIDYTSQTLGDVLLRENNPKSPYDVSKPTLVLWEGVSMYLEPSAVDAVLAFFKTNSTQGGSSCRIHLDAVDAAYVAAMGDSGGYGDKKLWDACVAKGEPFKMGIPVSKEGAVGYFRDRGYHLDFDAHHYGASRLENELLRNKYKVCQCIHYYRVDSSV